MNYFGLENSLKNCKLKMINLDKNKDYNKVDRSSNINL